MIVAGGPDKYADSCIEGLPLPLTTGHVTAGASPDPIARKPAPEENQDYELEHHGYRVRRVRLPERRRKASMLIQYMYSRRGYYTETACVLPHCLTRITLETSRGEELFGTLTLGLDSKEGLLADALSHSEVDVLRTMGRKLCEISSLAVDPRFGSKEVLGSLFHLAYIYGRVIHKATDVLIEVNPRHVKFYKRMLGFRQIGHVHTCPRVDAPAVLLHLELAYLETQIAKYAGYRSTAASSFLRQLQPLEQTTDTIAYAA
jgi:hypothetical protein